MIGNRVLLEIPSAFGMLKLVDAVSEQFGQQAGLDDDGIHCLAASVREAVANAIRHGNANDHLKPVRVSFTVSDAPPARVVVRVTDQGTGFEMDDIADPLAPENLAVPGGRGLLLMRTFMDDVQVRSLPAGGTEILLAKHIVHPAEGA